ncbi:MAG: NAD(P)H-binding protein [Enhygromyxa sp.]
MPGPVFVAGATGYTGREVVRECRARGLETVAHVRPDSRSLDSWRQRFEALGARVDTTAWELEAMSATLQALQPSWVYSLLGTTRARGKTDTGSAVAETYEAVDYGLSVMLLEAAIACGSKPRFVYLSAMGAGGRPMNAYMDVRKRVEAAVEGSELPHLIARPGFISGSDRDEWRAGERIAAVVSDGVLGVLGKLGARRLATRYTSMSGAELARALVELACASPGAREIAEVEQLKRAAG